MCGSTNYPKTHPSLSDHFVEPSKLIEHYTRLYEYQETDFRNSNLRKMVLKYAIGSHALEIGCGTGHLALDLLGRGFSVTAIDMSPEMVELTKQTTQAYQGQIQILPLRAEEIHKLEPQVFDLITGVDVLEHIQSDVDVLVGIYGRLSEQGRLLLVVPAHPCLYGIRDREMGHFRRYRQREIQHKLEQCGFTIKKMRFWNVMGVVPYYLSEKVLKRRVNEKLRYSRHSPMAFLFHFLMNHWFALFENHVHVGWGLSLFIIAEKSNIP